MKQAYTRVLAMLGSRAPRPGEPAMLLAAATIIIAVALMGIRGNAIHIIEPPVRLLASPVSMHAFRVPPRPKPVAVAPRARKPALPPVRISIPRSPMQRAAGIKAVLETAHQLIGRPYRYGAGGPHAFDCSGLTSFVWRAAGLSLPHNSRQQFNSLPRVPIDSLQPGDLVFSGHGRIGHVGLYIGNGKMINAPETGRFVEIEPLRGNFIGAARPALLLAP